MMCQCYGGRYKIYVFMIYMGEKKIHEEYTIPSDYYDELEKLKKNYPHCRITSMYLGEGNLNGIKYLDSQEERG